MPVEGHGGAADFNSVDQCRKAENSSTITEAHDVCGLDSPNVAAVDDLADEGAQVDASEIESDDAELCATTGISRARRMILIGAVDGGFVSVGSESVMDKIMSKNEVDLGRFVDDTALDTTLVLCIHSSRLCKSTFLSFQAIWLPARRVPSHSDVKMSRIWWTTGSKASLTAKP